MVSTHLRALAMVSNESQNDGEARNPRVFAQILELRANRRLQWRKYCGQSTARTNPVRNCVLVSFPAI